MATPAAAQYSRSGRLDWSFDDIDVRTKEGRRHESGFKQAYDYSMAGPLGSLLVGEGGASVSFTQGKNLAQSVAGADSNRKTLGYSFYGNLLPPGLRRYVNLAPSFSKTRSEQTWGAAAAPLNLVDTSQAINMGLALPRLPSVSVFRSRVRRQDASSRPTVDQTTDLQTEQSDYSHGPLRLRARRERSRTDDRLALAAPPSTEQKNADADLIFTSMKGRVESLSLRAAYQDHSLKSAAFSQRQDSQSASLALATKHFKSRLWESFLDYGAGYSRNSFARRNSITNTLTLISFNPRLLGRVDNQLSYQRTEGPRLGQSVTDNASDEWRSSSGKTALRTNVNGGWSKTTLSEGLHERLTLNPRPLYDLYGEAATAGTTPIGGGKSGSNSGAGSGGSRRDSLGSGIGLHPAADADLSGNYTFTRSVSFSNGAVGTSHSLSAQAQSAPMDGLKAAATYSRTWNRDSSGASSRGETLTLSANYSPLPELVISGEMTRERRTMNGSVNASYTVGKTRLSVQYERRELYSVNAFSHTSVTLSRSL